ncbi:MAG: hypothetical protein P8M25_03400 [Paracoccaceae bacterium]|nr:hypothetical protein [Paracoccaceae bacterium]
MPLQETGLTSLFALYSTAMIRNTLALLNNMNQTELSEVTLLLASARRVVLVGELSTCAIVEYAAYIAKCRFSAEVCLVAQVTIWLQTLWT